MDPYWILRFSRIVCELNGKIFSVLVLVYCTDLLHFNAFTFIFHFLDIIYLYSIFLTLFIICFGLIVLYVIDLFDFCVEITKTC